MFKMNVTFGLAVFILAIGYVYAETDWKANWIDTCSIIKYTKIEAPQHIPWLVDDGLCEDDDIDQCYKDKGCPDADGLSRICTGLSNCMTNGITEEYGECNKNTIKSTCPGVDADDADYEEKIMECLGEYSIQVGCRYFDEFDYPPGDYPFNKAMDAKHAVKEEDWRTTWLRTCDTIRDGALTVEGREGLVAEGYCEEVSDEAINQCYKDYGCPDADGLRQTCNELNKCITSKLGECEEWTVKATCPGDGYDTDEKVIECLGDWSDQAGCQYWFPPASEAMASINALADAINSLAEAQQRKRAAILKSLRALLEV